MACCNAPQTAPGTRVVLVASGHVSMEGMTIRDMQQCIDINSSGSVDLDNFDPTAMGIDVIIDNRSGTNFNGVVVTDNSSLNLGPPKLRINECWSAVGRRYGSGLSQQ